MSQNLKDLEVLEKLFYASFRHNNASQHRDLALTNKKSPNQSKRHSNHIQRSIYWSGRQDSNLRPTVPKTVALPGCATPRLNFLLRYQIPSIKASSKIFPYMYQKLIQTQGRIQNFHY